VEVLDILDTLMDAKSQAVLAEVDAASCGTKRDGQRADEAHAKLCEVSRIAGDSFLTLLRERNAALIRARTAERKLAEVAKSMEHIERLHAEIEALVKGLPARVIETLAAERAK
jgi:hypothetical protein